MIRFVRRASTLFCLTLGTALAVSNGCGSDTNNNNVDGGGGHGGGGGLTGSGGGGGAVTGSGGGGGATDGGTDGVDGAAAALSQAQAIAVAEEANSGEVHAAEIALTRSTNSDVLAFATMMTTDHNAANMRLQALVQQAGLTAEDSATRRTLSTQTQQTLDSLWAATTSSFDLTYVNSQIAMHTMVLQLLQNSLIPAVQDAQLRTELQAEQTAVTAHLASAQQLHATLTGDGGAGDAATGTGGADGGTAGADASSQ
jgi:putative membrane protein